jgi:hypothetical protein
MNTQRFVFALLVLVGCGGGGGESEGGSSSAASFSSVAVRPYSSGPVSVVVQNRSLTAGAQVDQGETDDPAVDTVSYAGQVYYVDCINGNDSNDGLAANRAWRTVTQVNTKTNVGYWDTAAPNGNTSPANHAPWTAAPSGSAFLFKRGCTFDGFVNVHGYLSTTNGVSVYANNITLGAYGVRSQARPVIQYQTASTKFRGVAVWTNGHTIKVRNLHLLGSLLTNAGGVSLNGTRDSVVENSTVENFGLDGILADKSKNLLIKNASVVNTQTSGGRGGGLAGSGTNIQVLYSTFVNNGRDQVGAHNIYLRHLTNATIQGNLLRGGSNLGIVIHGSSTGVSIVRNDIDGNSNGIDITGGYPSEAEVFDNFLIAENVIHGNGYRTGEQGYGILVKSMTNSLIANNVLYGNRLGSLVFADANTGDATSSGVQIIHNTFVNPATSNGLTFVGAAMGSINFRNNIVSTQSTAEALQINTNVPSRAITMGGNLYYAPQIAANRVLNIAGARYTVSSAITAGFESNSFYGDPLFTNQANADFTIAMNSPAKSGAPLTMLNVVSMVSDYAGMARAVRPSIGAYE